MDGKAYLLKSAQIERMLAEIGHVIARVWRLRNRESRLTRTNLRCGALMILSQKNPGAVMAGIAKLGCAATLALALSGPAWSEASALAPQTKLRLSVVQWAPSSVTFSITKLENGEAI